MCCILITNIFASEYNWMMVENVRRNSSLPISLRSELISVLNSFKLASRSEIKAVKNKQNPIIKDIAHMKHIPEANVPTACRKQHTKYPRGVFQSNGNLKLTKNIIVKRI